MDRSRAVVKRINGGARRDPPNPPAADWLRAVSD